MFRTIYAIRRAACAAPLRMGVVLLAFLLASTFTGLAIAQEAPRLTTDNIFTAVREGSLEDALKALGEVVDRSDDSELQSVVGIESAAGAVYRKLAQLSIEEQYDLLYAWSMPNKNRNNVRVLTCLVPQTSPPNEMARVLGERPRPTSFAVASVGSFRGLFSSAWMLVNTAKESGKLRKLVAELEALPRESFPHVNQIILLSKIAEGRDEAGLTETLTNLLKPSNGLPSPPASVLPPFSYQRLELAAAATEMPKLRDAAEKLFDDLAKSYKSEEIPHLRAYLQSAHAIAAQLHRGESGIEILRDPRLKYWIAASGSGLEDGFGGEIVGSTPPMWLTHQEHVLHVAGSGNDMLLLRYPIEGDFEFRCEMQEGGEADIDNGFVYGGLQFGSLGVLDRLNVCDAALNLIAERPCPFIRHAVYPVFNRFGIRSTAGKAVFLVNLHPMWSDENASSSPWLGLRSFAPDRPIFRNLAFTGSPTIPKSVDLFGKSELRGWLPITNGFLSNRPREVARPAEAKLPLEAESPLEAELRKQPGSSSPQLTPASDPAARTARLDAESAAGSAALQASPPIVEAPKLKLTPGGSEVTFSATATADVQNVAPEWLFAYQRPLLESESFSYEYFYEPGKTVAHPSLGRLTFLVEPEGIRIHWVTSGEREWTGLKPEHAATEPLNRRGPKPLPLKANDWNRIKLTRDPKGITLALNDITVYQRPIDWAGDLRCGFFLNPTRESLRVRKAVLTGDWPDKLPEEFFKNPLTLSSAESRPRDRQTAAQVTGEEFLQQNLTPLMRRAKELPPPERFRYLASEILPTAERSSFRVVGFSVPTSPAKPATVKAFTSTDGNLDSPVFEWLRLAAELGKLEETLETLKKFSEPDSRMERHALLSLVGMLHLRRSDWLAAITQMEHLVQSLIDARSEPPTTVSWSELLFLQVAMQAPTGKFPNDLMLQLANELKAYGNLPGHPSFAAQLASYQGRLRAVDELPNGIPIRDSPIASEWLEASTVTARTRGQGFPHAKWSYADGVVQHTSGHHLDYLIYKQPLIGTYQVEGDVSVPSLDICDLVAGGILVAAKATRDEIEIDGPGETSTTKKLNPPLGKFDRWIHQRHAVAKRESHYSINGRLIYTARATALSEPYPWFSIRSGMQRHGLARDIRVTGSEQVPDQINLISAPSLPGWTSYFEESIGDSTADWTARYDTQSTGRYRLQGRRHDELNGTNCESYIYYQRPLQENESVEYEFYYDREKPCVVHPGLDRLIFLLNESGVNIHWLTDGKYDSTDLSPDNIFEEPENRRGSDRLPLADQAWNQIRLALQDQRVKLELNGKLIYERLVEPTNQRTVGFFHFADRSEVLVRNIVMRGNWSTSLPPVDRQSLAGTATREIDAGVAKLTSTFQHDFTKKTLDRKFFKPLGNNGGHVQREPVGLRVGAGLLDFLNPFAGSMPPSVKVALNFAIHGDFDIAVAFEQLRFGGGDLSANFQVQVALQNQAGHNVLALRGQALQDRPIVRGTISVPAPDGKRRATDTLLGEEATSGRLRLSRRGETIHCLFAEGDSANYRLICSYQASADPIPTEGLTFGTFSTEGKRFVSAVVKNVTIQAEKLMHYPAPSDRDVLRIMNADGTGLRDLLTLREGYNDFISEEWIKDGSMISVVMRSDQKPTMMFIVDPKTGEAQEIGPGWQPSYAPDGVRFVYTDGAQLTIQLANGEKMAIDKPIMVTIVDSKGTVKTIAQSSAVSPVWSPDGKSIATFTSDNIQLYDVERRTTRALFSGEVAKRYTRLYLEPAWSNDGRSIAFAARPRTQFTYDICVVDIDKPNEIEVLYNGPVIDPGISWLPDNRTITLPLKRPDAQFPALYTLTRGKPGPPTLLANQPRDHKMSACDWSPDGKQLIFTSRAPSHPVEWKGDGLQ